LCGNVVQAQVDRHAAQPGKDHKRQHDECCARQVPSDTDASQTSHWPSFPTVHYADDRARRVFSALEHNTRGAVQPSFDTASHGIRNGRFVTVSGDCSLPGRRDADVDQIAIRFAPAARFGIGGIVLAPLEKLGHTNGDEGSLRSRVIVVTGDFPCSAALHLHREAHNWMACPFSA
jgi:hypothetical protein